MRLVITRDQVAYARYVAYCGLLHQHPLTFDRWLQESARIPEYWGAVKIDNMAGRLGSSIGAARRRA